MTSRMIRRGALALAVIVAVATGCTIPQSSPYQQSTPVLGVEQGFVVLCHQLEGGSDPMYLIVDASHDVQVSYAIEGDAAGDGPTRFDAMHFPLGWGFVGERLVEAEQCVAVTITDSLGEGPFTFRARLARYSGGRWEGGSPIGGSLEAGFCNPPGSTHQFLLTDTADGDPVQLRFEAFTDDTVYYDETRLMADGDVFDVGQPVPDCYTFRITNVSPGREGVTFFFRFWYPYDFCPPCHTLE